MLLSLGSATIAGGTLSIPSGQTLTLVQGTSLQSPVDNQGTFEVGVDNVSLQTVQTAAVPEPGTLGLVAGACLLGLARFGKIGRCRMSRSSE